MSKRLTHLEREHADIELTPAEEARFEAAIAQADAEITAVRALSAKQPRVTSGHERTYSRCRARRAGTSPNASAS